MILDLSLILTVPLLFGSVTEADVIITSGVEVFCFFDGVGLGALFVLGY